MSTVLIILEIALLLIEHREALLDCLEMIGGVAVSVYEILKMEEVLKRVVEYGHEVWVAVKCIDIFNRVQTLDPADKVYRRWMVKYVELRKTFENTTLFELLEKIYTEIITNIERIAHELATRWILFLMPDIKKLKASTVMEQPENEMLRLFCLSRNQNSIAFGVEMQLFTWEEAQEWCRKYGHEEIIPLCRP